MSSTAIDPRTGYLSHLLDWECERHRQTKALLMQTQNTAEAWERLYHIAQSEAQSYKTRLSAAELQS